jgi:hypothetical protein
MDNPIIPLPQLEEFKVTTLELLRTRTEFMQLTIENDKYFIRKGILDNALARKEKANEPPQRNIRYYRKKAKSPDSQG